MAVLSSLVVINSIYFRSIVVRLAYEMIRLHE